MTRQGSWKSDLEELPFVLGAGEVEDGVHVDEGVGVPDAAAVPPLQNRHIQRNLLHL